jgi:cell shape-determining protein MreC
METNEKENRKETFIFNVVSACSIGMLILLIFLMMTSCGSVAPATRYAKTHADNNYENRLKGNDSFTFKSVKDDFKNTKADIRDQKKLDKQNAKVSAMQERINKLKNNNQ